MFADDPLKSPGVPGNSFITIFLFNTFDITFNKSEILVAFPDPTLKIWLK